MIFIDRTSLSNCCVSVVVALSLLVSAFPASFFDFSVNWAQAASTDTIQATVLPAATPERFTISYTGSNTLNLEDWVVTDAQSFSYVFGGQSLATGDSITVCQTNGDQAGCDATWGGSPVWNNGGDTFTLADPNGEVVLTFAFGAVTEATDSVAIEVLQKKGGDQLDICHATGSAENPYSALSPNLNSLLSSGHLEHAEDIIPPFFYDSGDGIQYFSGSNWDSTGQEIYRNDCTDGNGAPTTPDQTIRPILECWVDNGDDTGTAYFGYRNDNSVPVDVPVGDNNKVTGVSSSPDVGQPTNFLPGRTDFVDDGGVFKPENAAFAVDFPLTGNAVWTLDYPDGQGNPTATAGTNGPRCPAPVPPEEVATISATKFVCTDESDLPNWGVGGDDITATTASDWLAANPNTSCQIVTDWEFEWAPRGVSVPSGYNTYIGPAGDGWTTFTGSTTVPASVFANKGTIELREVIPSTDYDTFAGGKNNVSPEFYCGSDVLNYDNLERISSPVAGETYHCVAWNVTEPTVSDVTMCKYDEAGNPLPGWTLMLLGEQVDTVTVPAADPAGVDSVALTGGASYVAIANGTWDNNRGPLNIVDAEYSTEDNWTTWMDGFTTFPTDILELFIAGQGDPDSVWGTYNSSHRYAQSFVPEADGVVTFNINDTNYTDNTGSLEVEIYDGYAGLTGETGCVRFSDVPYGSYDAAEIMLDGWEHVSGMGPVVVDQATETFRVVNRDLSVTPVATIVAEKVVCETEADLPNWNDNGEAPTITADTAATFVVESDGACWLADDWYFEWAPQGTSNPDNDLPDNPFYGAAGGNWTTFGPTDGSGKATVNLTTEAIAGDSHVWVREVLADEYVPFTYGPGNQSNTDNQTAELYCHTDGRNYDNYDRVDGIQVDSTYHCVAFNTLQPAEQCTLDIYSDTGTLVVETNQYAVAAYDGNDAWTADIPGATWIWATEYVTEPVIGEQYTFRETFTVENPTTATLDVAADNWYRIFINDELVYDRAGMNSYRSFQQIPTLTNEILVELQSGENEMVIEVINEPLTGGTVLSNPAGLLFHLSVTAEAESCERTTKPEPEEYLIEGYKYELISDEGRVGLPNWVIELYDDAGVLVATTTTSADGYYSFPVLEGAYEVREVMQDGWEFSFIEQNGSIPLSAQDDAVLEFCSFTFPQLLSEAPLLEARSLEGSELSDLVSVQPTGGSCDFYNARSEENDDDDDDDNDNDNDNDNGTNPSTSNVGSIIERATARVAGAATTSICPFLNDHMQIGWENNPWEVIKLQLFLSMVMGYSNPITGIFDRTTDENVKAFQLQYQDEILTPWYEAGIVPHNRPTGFVYKTTKWKINDIVCPGDPFPSFDGEDLTRDIDVDHNGW